MVGPKTTPLTPKKPIIAVVDATFVAAAHDKTSLPSESLPEVAFAGRSNVGKSSLLSTLTGRKKLVRISSTPGCTRGINFFNVELKRTHEGASENHHIQLVDLPGYGFAKRSHGERKTWKKLIESYLENRATLRSVLLIVDPRRGMEEDDQTLLEYLAHLNHPAILVATKMDLLAKHERKLSAQKLAQTAHLPVYTFSATLNEGSQPLWKAIWNVSSDKHEPYVNCRGTPASTIC